MLTTTDAIVLALQPQSDKARLLHTYTRSHGRAHYKVYGGSKQAAGKYNPLSLLQITADEHSIRTAQLTFVPTTITTDPYKRTIVLFMSEILYQTLRYPMADEPLFDFLIASIQSLDQTPDPRNFHISFLIDFAAQLGFAIDPESDDRHLLILPSTRADRQKQLHSLCTYFASHIDTWQEPRSLDVLTEVFD